MAPILTLRNLTLAFGGTKALRGVDLDAASGECVALVGPNGSGKSTVVNLVAGLYRPDVGTVLFEGRDITRTTMRRRVRLGIARTHQTPRFFDRMTVLENLRTALDVHGSWLDALFVPPSRRQAAEKLLSHTLETFGLADRRNATIDRLTLLERRRLEIARAILAEPKLLLLDEPAAGLSVAEAEALTELLSRAVLGTGRAVVLIEHREPVLQGLATRSVAMNAGRLVEIDRASSGASC